MNRICPNCNRNLKENDRYFCLSCGAKLESHLVRRTASFIPRKVIYTGEKKVVVDGGDKKNNHKNVLFALGILAGFIILSLGWFSITKFVSYKQSINKSNAQEQVVEKSMYNYTFEVITTEDNVIFGAQAITKFVPFDVDYYIEGNNYSQLTGDLLEQNFADKLNNKLGLALAGKFVVFGRNSDTGWHHAVVVLASEEELASLIDSQALKIVLESSADVVEDLTPDLSEGSADIIEEVVPDSPYTIEIIENVVVITNYDEFIQEIKQSADGLVKNVTHNPRYSSFSAFLPPDGQLRFMVFTEDIESIYQLSALFKSSESTDKILEQILQAKYDKFVLRNNER